MKSSSLLAFSSRCKTIHRNRRKEGDKALRGARVVRRAVHVCLVRKATPHPPGCMLLVLMFNSVSILNLDFV